MDSTIDHTPPSTPRTDTKPPTTSLPIARFPTTTAATGTGSSTKRAAGSSSSTTVSGDVIKKTSSSTASAPARRRSGSSTSSWSGIRPVERQLMRPWLIQKIDAGIVDGLEWVDAAHTRFRIPWKHGSRQGWKTEQDACLFMHWAQHTGRYRGSEAPNAKRWKANFRCALNSLPDAREVKTQSQTKGQNAYRVYEFLNERKAKVQPARTANIKPKCTVDGVKMEIGLTSSPTDMQDVKYPLTPCTSGSPSGLGHQNTTNEEPLDQIPYSQSPVPSPTTSFSSTCSEDPYSPCSPPPAAHTANNISRNWQLHMKNDSYRAIFPSATSSPSSLPAPSTTTSTWAPQAAATNINSTFKRDVTATSSPSHAFPASPDHVMTSSTSYPATPVTSQASMFNNGRSATQMPYLTMDIGLSSHIDYDSGLGSPSSSGLGSPTSGFGSSSSGLGSPSSNHSDMDYACSDDGSDVSVEISKSHIEELKRECLKTSQGEATFQHYPHYQQRLDQQQQPTHHQSPTYTHNNNYNNLYQNRPQHNAYPNQHSNNQFNLQSNQLAGDYGLVEALQNAFNIPEEIANLNAEEVESVLSAGPYLNVDYKITVKTGFSIASTIEANLTADVQNYNGQT